MKMKFLGLKNSIYQQRGVNGLQVKDGMLINDRPDSRTGIAKIADMRKAEKYTNKVNMMADGYVLGDIKAKSMGLEDMD